MTLDALHAFLAGRAGVALFGSGEPGPGDPLYEEARRAATHLASAGWVVITGGYGGVMEAASRGAREAGGVAIGVTLEAWRGRGPGNAWLSLEVREPDLHLRTRSLIEAASGFLVLDGRAGTLAEAAFLFALRRAGHLGEKPVVLSGARWTAGLSALRRSGLLEEQALALTWLEDDAERGALRLVRLLGGGSPPS